MSTKKAVRQTDAAHPDVNDTQPLGKRAFVVVESRSPKSKEENATQDKADRRKHPRLPLLVGVEYRVGDSVQNGVLSNLSLGGVFLVTQEPLPAGTIMTMLINLPWKLGEVAAEARVTWSSGTEGTELDPPGVGLCFTQIDPDGKKKLKAYARKFQQIAAQLAE
jgi:Tfp pilus assembly protein PilZ